MKALIVHESAWGNTRAVAEAVAAGLEGAATTEVVDVEHAPALAGMEVDLLVVGAPTHAFGLSLGCTVVTEPTSFWVEDYEGPLLPGELERARVWGSHLAAHLTPSRS